MKKAKIAGFFCCILAAGLLFTGCGKKGTEYKNGSESYSIKIPGEFTQAESDNQDHIILNNVDGTLSVVVQMFPKNQVNASTLDDFIKLYHDNAIPQMIANTDAPTVSDVKVDAMTAAKSEEFSVNTDDKQSKALFIYMSSESSFYVYSITGQTSVYDENIEALKEAVSTLKEAKKKD